VVEDRFNRAVNRMFAWVRWQFGLVKGEGGAGRGPAFQPSFLTGALTLAALVYQVVSGGLLLLYYQPSVSSTLTLCGQASGAPSPSPAAWCSTFYVMHSVPGGGVLLTTHLYGAYATIFLMMVHLFRGYYLGAYKQLGGKFSWVLGVGLLLLLLGMGFTGYLLVYTQLSYNATQVSITLIQSLPILGPSLANLFVGDGTPQSLLSRMFAAHVVLLPVAIALLAFLHKRTQLFPNVYASLAKWGLLYVGALVGVASLWLWPLPTYAGNVGATQPLALPSWYFLWVFKLVDFVGVTPEEAMLFASLLVAFLVLLPFVDRSHRVHPRDRPVVLFLGNSLVGFFVLMTAWGYLAPGGVVTPTEAGLRVGPIVAANALVVAVFYRRYRRACATRSSSRELSPVLEPTAPASVGPSAKSSGSLRTRKARDSWPSLLSLAGLGASLFLLAFGLVLPFLCLAAAFLVNLAELSGPSRKAVRPRPSDPFVFPMVGLVTVSSFLVLLFVAVLS